jgi:hypothetical protein
MNDEHSKTSGKSATAELDHDTKHADRPDRSTTAGLGLFDKVTSMTGNPGGTITTGLGLPKFDAMDTGVGTGITGVDRTVSAAGVTYTSRFSDEDDRHWRQSHASRPYYESGRAYDEYRPAYQYGTDAAHHYQGRRWEDVEGDLESGWDNARGTSRSAWRDIKDAVRDAWDRATGGHHNSR